MGFFSRLTRFEERVWEVVEGAFALGERIAHQVSRATGDAAVGACEALFSPLCESAPLSQSPSLPASQDDEVFASSALLQEQHTSEATSQTQGLEQTQDITSGLVPESSSSAFVLARCASQSSAFFSSQDGNLTSARSSPLLTHTSCSGEASQMQGLEQNHDGSDESVPALEKDELFCSQLLASAELPTQLCERGLCGATEGALPAGGDRVSKEEKGAGSGRSQTLILAEPSGGACQFERLDRGCVYKILQKVTDTHLKECSLVRREWLEISNEVRSTMMLERTPQVSALPAMVLRFSQLSWLTLSDEAAAACTNDAFVHHVARLSKLRFLRVRGCGGLSDMGLAAVLRGCCKLRTLILEQCGGFNGVAFEGVHCGKLEELALDRCPSVKNMGLLSVSDACPGLVHLTLKRESDNVPLAAGLRLIAESCTGLRELVLHACGLTDKTLEAFAVGCPALSCVDLTCEQDITDRGVKALTSRLYQLQTLILYNNRKLFEVPRSGPGLRLKTLCLGWFWYTPDDLLRQVAEEESLETVQFSGCSLLTDATIERILAKCCHLKMLGLAFNDNDNLTPSILDTYAKCGRKCFVQIKKCQAFDAGALAEKVSNLYRVEIDRDS